MARFNMGCGLNKLEGYINVDAMPGGEPDELFDLEQTPWPWPDNSAEEVVFNHSLEHMGGDPKVFLAIMVELYRICAPGAAVHIRVPDPRHDHFINDPTHVRMITPNMLQLFDRELNEQWGRQRGANSPLALYTGVDFKLAHYRMVLAEPYGARFDAGELSAEQARQTASSLNNVIQEWVIRLEVRKPQPA